MDLNELKHEIENPPVLTPFRSLDEYVAQGISTWQSQSGMFGRLGKALGLMMARDPYIERYGFVLPTAEVMAALAVLLKPRGRVMDAGSGTGFLAAELCRRGVDVCAVDHCDYRVPADPNRHYSLSHVEQLDHRADAAALLPGDFGAVLLVWPPHGLPFAAEVAKAMAPGQMLVYEGEGCGGATAHDDFFTVVDNKSDWELLGEGTATLNSAHVVMPGLHDHWRVWQRLPARGPGVL